MESPFRDTPTVLKADLRLQVSAKGRPALLPENNPADVPEIATT